MKTFMNVNRRTWAELQCVGNCLQLPRGHSSLTCNHLPPALIQVRGNYVPHGHTTASTDLQLSELLTGCSQGWICVGGISNSVKYPNRAAGKMLRFPPERCTAPALLLLRVSEVQRRRTEARWQGGRRRWRRRWTLAWFTEAGHTLWESSLVQRVQSALPRVWPEPGA